MANQIAKKKPYLLPEFRAVVMIKGMTNETLYGATLDKLTVRAIRRLTRWKPGSGSCYPLKILFEGRGNPLKSRNGYTWLVMHEVQYANIPEEQLEWKKTERARQVAATVKAPPSSGPLVTRTLLGDLMAIAGEGDVEQRLAKHLISKGFTAASFHANADFRGMPLWPAILTCMQDLERDGEMYSNNVPGMRPQDVVKSLARLLCQK
jgi:hypothetical protein